MKAASLNHVYRLVWSHVQNAWTVVAEIAKAQGKQSTVTDKRANASQQSNNHSLAWFRLKSASVLVGLVLSQMAYALPGDITVTNGSFTQTVDGKTMYINQTSQKATGRTWGFDIAADESVYLNQPTNGMLLVHVLGNNATEIYGQLNATGKLFLINQNGILFGESSQVSAGGIVASTLAISETDFMQGRYSFKADGVAGNVVNKGVIHAKDDGYIVMLGKSVENAGTLVADKGSVVLASAKEAVLDFFGNGLVQVKLSGDAIEAAVKNTGLIQAAGGLVQLATSARSSAIIVSGIIEADTLTDRDGVIRLEGGDNAKVQVSGKLLADGGDGKGGNITVTGEQVALMSGALVDASGDTGGGTVLIGGDYQGSNAQVYNARTTYISSGAAIHADARTQGDGGKVIVWSDHATRYYGTISAVGGTVGGHGGFAEVSGKNYLNFTGAADLSAKNGTSGTLLLDPLDIELTTVDSNTTGFTAGLDSLEAFSDDAGAISSFNVNAGGSFSGVAGGTNINLNAERNITVSTNVNLNTATGNNNVSLTLTAKQNVNLNADIVADGTGSIEIYADSDNNGTGNLNMAGNIVTDRGLVILTAANFNHSSGNITTNGATVLMGATNTANLGNININTYDRSTGANKLTGGNILIGGGVAVNMTNAQLNTVNPAESGVTYSSGQGGNVAVLSLGSVNLGDTKINVAGESETSVNLPIAGANVAISGNVLIGGAAVQMNAGAINTNGMAVTGASTDLNLTGNVVVASVGNVNLGNTSIDTTGSTPANSNGVNAGTVFVVGQNIVTGDITANGTAATSANGNGGTGGQVQLNGLSGNLTVGNISVAGGDSNGTGNAGNGSAISLTPVAGTVTMKSIDTHGGVATGSGVSGNGGAVDINGNVLLAADATIDSTGVTGGTVNFNGTVNSASSGSYALSVKNNATTNFKQSIGGNKALASLTTDTGGTTELFGSLVKTTGNQTYNDTVNLNTDVTFETTAGGNVTFNSVLNAIANAITVNTGTGDFSAMSTSNQLDHIKVTSAKNVSIQDMDNLTIDDVDMSGDLLAIAQNNLTLNGDIVTTSSSNQAVQLVAKNSFDNTANHSITTAGRWLVYSNSPLLDVRGAKLLNDYNFKQYNTSYGGTILGTGNGFIYTIAPTVTATMTGAASKVYDGTVDATGLTFTSSPTTIDGDTVTITALTASFDNRNVGTNKTVTTNNMVVTAENGGKQVYGIGLDNTTASANVGTITQREITVTAATDTKVYDGSTASSAGPTVTTGSIVAGDTGNFTQQFDSRHAGSRTLTASGTVDDGNSGGNYKVNFVDNSGSISQRTITVTAATDSKVYDGSNASSAGPTVTSGVIVTGDTGNFTQVFDSRNAGTRTLTASGTIDDGNSGGNYQILFTGNSGSISQRAITVTAATDSKVYDGSNTSSAGPTVTTGAIVAGDTGNFTQVFDSRNAGSRTLTASGDVSDGNGGNNYAVTYIANSGTINQRAITVTAATDTKVYDGTTTSSAGPTVTAGTIVAGDTAAFSQTFADKNAGTGKTLTASGAVSDGNAGANYVMTFVNNTTGTITQAQISTVAGITANDKVFDGTTAATLNTGSASFNGIISGDQLTVATATGNFIDSAVGAGKTVNISGIALGGADAGNYVLIDTTAVTTASILPSTDPRTSAGLGGLVGGNPVLNSLTIVSLNPAAGDDDPDYVPCPVVEDKLGSTPVLNSGVKLPNGVIANCI